MTPAKLLGGAVAVLALAVSVPAALGADRPDDREGMLGPGALTATATVTRPDDRADARGPGATVTKSVTVTRDSPADVRNPDVTVTATATVTGHDSPADVRNPVTPVTATGDSPADVRNPVTPVLDENARVAGDVVWTQPSPPVSRHVVVVDPLDDHDLAAITFGVALTLLIVVATVWTVGRGGGGRPHGPAVSH